VDLENKQHYKLKEYMGYIDLSEEAVNIIIDYKN